MIGEQLLVHFRDIPSRQIAVNTVHEGGVVSHLGRHRTKKVADPLLMCHVDLEIAEHHDAALSSYALAAARKLARLHVPLHDVYTVLLIEGDARDFVEANDVVLANQTALAVRHIDEHASDRRLASGNEMGVGGDLLEQVTLTSTARTQFDHVVIGFDEGHHSKQHGVLEHAD